MLLAINYSHEAATLFAEKRISIDRFKTPDWPDMIVEASAYVPVIVHFNLYAGRGDLKKTDWERIRTLSEQTGTPYVNLHLNPSRKNYPDFSVDPSRKRDRTRIIDDLMDDVSTVVEQFGPDRVIVENEPYRGQFGDTLRPGVDPDVIYHVTGETGCGFLLDLSHARISACYLGMDEFEYLKRLPVHRLREMHFTGLNWVNGILRDHLPAVPADWQSLSWALERIHQGSWSKPWLLAFEYGGVGEKFVGRRDPAVMAEQLPKLRNTLMSI
jgi:uncharacterized protein (UPF0276 family)